MTGESVYGADYALRRGIERSGRGYVLAVTSRQRLGFKTVADWLEDVPSNGWQRLSAGDGAKGPRLYDWAWLPYWSDAESGWQKGLLIRRKASITAGFPGLFVVSSGCVGRAADAGGASTTRRARPHDQAAEPRPDARAGGALREW